MNGTNVIMFQQRFADKVLAGSKRTTIRLPRKRAIAVGDELSLRMWEGKPYRSPQRILMRSICTKVEDFRIESGECLTITISDQNYTPVKKTCLDEVATLDGFIDWREMVAWFDKTHGLPFAGVRIHWGAKL